MNDHWSFWGKKETPHIDQNYIFSFTALKYLCSHYIENYGVSCVNIFSDGCANQYKSRYIMNLQSNLCQELGMERIILNNYATGQAKGIPDSLGNDSKGFLHRKEISGSVRCADAWEVFLALTDPESGMPQPRPVHDISKKKQFQLDARYHRFIVAEELLTDTMRARIDIDVCFLFKPPNGHRENSVEIKGIQDIYQFMTVKDVPGCMYVRKQMCFCRFCVLYKYDDCLTNSKWEKLNLKIDLSKDVNYLDKLAEFYHAHNWDQYIVSKPPIVAFYCNDIIRFAILKNKPIRCSKSMTIKEQKNINVKSIYFKVPANSWCLSVDLLNIKESCTGHNIYILDSSPEAQNILIPIHNLIRPTEGELELNDYYGYFNFIKYERKDSLYHNSKLECIENFKIKRDVLERLNR